MKTLNRGFAAAALVLLLLPGPELAGQSLPFEEKARYERTLEQKADEVLVRLLGPNQAKVVIEATMDFSRTEKLEVSGEPAAKDPFKWQAAGGDAQSGDYLMPGFPSFAAGGSENKTYNRQTMSPSSFVKKLAVSVIVNKDLPDAAADNLRRVVEEVLMMDTARGDQLSVIKTPFAPLWRTIWYTPEALSMVLKYVMVALMGIIGMIVVSVGFLRLAGAMSTMAKVQQSHQITMDLGKGAAPGGGEAALAAPGGAGLPAGLLPAPAGPGESDAGGDGGRVVFNVTSAQVPFLVNMMSGEAPDNVALMAAHLPAAVKTEFLQKLPPAFSSEIFISMAKIRFVEPEVISTLKEELERRLAGAVGGIEGVLSVMETLGLRGKQGLIAELSKKQPELAAELRRHVLLPEDLGRLSDKEMSLLAAALKPEEWALALFALPEDAKLKLRGQLADKTWQMIEQSMGYGAPLKEKSEEAVERVMASVVALIKEGRIANPVAVPLPLIGGGQAA